MPTEIFSFKDPRDGQAYPSGRMEDGKVWMLQNLNFNLGKNNWNYKNDPNKAKILGRLYTWEGAQSACPPGWHLPIDDEWKALAMAYGGYFDAKIKKDMGDPKLTYKMLLKEGESKFAAVLGGFRLSHGDYHLLDRYGYYWTRTGNNIEEACSYYFNSITRKLDRGFLSKNWGLSCRCILD